MLLKLAFANVRRSYRDFAIYFVTLVIGVAVYYAFNSVGAQQGVLALSEEQGSVIESLGGLIGYVSAFITVILAFLVVYASRFLIRRRNKEFGLYLLMGMPRTTLLSLTALETAFVGVLSLACGMGAGVLLSQGLVAVTALMFEADLSGSFAFVFSAEACIQAVAVFAALFAVSLLINVGHLARLRLIELINADRKNDALALRSIPLSFALFIVSCVLIGIAYKLLLEHGLFTGDIEFVVSTVLVCAGTMLFFYSLAGFALAALQRIRSLYYRGLNMFVVRQVASRINSSFASMGVICLTLFLALTSVCGGVGICTTLQAGYAEQTAYDASVRSYYGYSDGTDGQADSSQGAYQRFEGSMADGLAQGFEAVGAVKWDSLVRASAQIDYRLSDATMGDLDDLAGVALSDMNSALQAGTYEDSQLYVVALSQYNAARELAGKEALSVPEGSVLLSADNEAVLSWVELAARSGGDLEVFGKDFALMPNVDETCMETTSTPMNTGMLVMNDADIPAEAPLVGSLLDVQLIDEGARVHWQAGMDKLQSASYAGDESLWGVAMYQTKQGVFDGTVGITTLISYLAVYIGFVLVMACAAILAIQQLTGASDNRRRYELLARLGASQRMVDGTLFRQVAVAFVAPLALALCHTVCAMAVVVDFVKIFGHVAIGQAAGITAASFLAVYAAYFLLTCLQAKRMIRA